MIDWNLDTQVIGKTYSVKNEKTLFLMDKWTREKQRSFRANDRKVASYDNIFRGKLAEYVVYKWASEVEKLDCTEFSFDEYEVTDLVIDNYRCSVKMRDDFKFPGGFIYYDNPQNYLTRRNGDEEQLEKQHSWMIKKKDYINPDYSHTILCLYNQVDDIHKITIHKIVKTELLLENLFKSQYESQIKDGVMFCYDQFV